LGENQKPQVEKRNLGTQSVFPNEGTATRPALRLATVKLFLEMWNKDK
jgi:hypothetical protein